MPRGGYEQHRLNDDRPTKKKPCFEASIVLDFKCPEQSGRVVFNSALEDVQGEAVTQNTRAGGENPVANVSINEDCTITVILNSGATESDQKWWRFSDRYDAITTKEELRDFYGDLQYHDDNAIRLLNDCSSPIIGYRKISFKVKHNKHGRHGSSHGFSINVDLLQTDPTDPKNEDRSAWEWLPITIDPEIKNPPPTGGGKLDPEHGSAPLV